LRLNKSPPDIYFKRKKTGGVSFNTVVSVAPRLATRCVCVCSRSLLLISGGWAMPGCYALLQVPLTRIDESTVNRILYEYKIHHCEVRAFPLPDGRFSPPTAAAPNRHATSSVYGR
jgi:hypothetical protein